MLLHALVFPVGKARLFLPPVFTQLFCLPLRCLQQRAALLPAVCFNMSHNRFNSLQARSPHKLFNIRKDASKHKIA